MSSPNLGRRRLIQASLALGGLGLAGFWRNGSSSLYLAPIRTHPGRLFDITVGLRPFRPQGPRIEAEQIGDTRVVHNYGHGGSGWSLSWGSAHFAVQKALVDNPARVAVIGCGVIGLTSAILAQRAGAKVTIYARNLLPQTSSSRAMASWAPDSRIALAHSANRQFGDLWEQMARISFKAHLQYLGRPGTPVEWVDHYRLSDAPFDDARVRKSKNADGFARYEARIAGLVPQPRALPAGVTPFPVKFVRHSRSMQFNIASYSHVLMSEFFAAGGKFVQQEFQAPAELTRLNEKVVINCPGCGARQWWGDSSMIPVRGQIAWLVPQSEVDYGFEYRGVSVLARRDGILVEDSSQGALGGYGDDREQADNDEAERALGTVARLYAPLGASA